jgi:hypothetical protein
MKEGKHSMKQIINKEELNRYWNSHYSVKIVVPRDENPYVEEFIFDQDDLDKYLENYAKTAEFIVSVELLG